MQQQLSLPRIHSRLVHGRPPLRASAANEQPIARAKALAKARAKAKAKARAKAKGKARARPARRQRLILEIDESFLNKRKRSRLSAGARPQTDRLWLWGMVAGGHPEVLMFRVLEHPDDAFNGRPRGNTEILKRLHLVDVP